MELFYITSKVIKPHFNFNIYSLKCRTKNLSFFLLRFEECSGHDLELPLKIMNNSY